MVTDELVRWGCVCVVCTTKLCIAFFIVFNPWVKGKEGGGLSVLFCFVLVCVRTPCGFCGQLRTRLGAGTVVCPNRSMGVRVWVGEYGGLTNVMFCLASPVWYCVGRRGWGWGGNSLGTVCAPSYLGALDHMRRGGGEKERKGGGVRGVKSSRAVKENLTQASDT